MNLPWIKKGAAAQGEAAAPSQSGKKPFWKRWKKKRLVALALVCALAVWGGGQLLGGGSTAAAAQTSYTTAQVTRMDITSSITGRGTLEAADSYSVTTLLEDTILTADFEEGDEVEEGAVSPDDNEMPAATGGLVSAAMRAVGRAVTRPLRRPNAWERQPNWWKCTARRGRNV